MNLHVLPVRTSGAAENMAVDFLLLQRYPTPTAPRFRHYNWRSPAHTFGFGQKIAFVRESLAADLPCDLCRRPTGGGIVDHRHDWTYALVVPRGHALYDSRASQSYRVVHECLAAALGQPAVVKTACEPSADGEPCAPGPGVCFQRAELCDVINTATGAKIAGAAQKRNKHGLLFQGSIEKRSVHGVDWETFGHSFTERLALALGTPPEEVPWPEFPEHESEGLTEQYASPEWLEYR